MKVQTRLLILFIALLYGCAADNVLTKKEMATQNKADAVVANVLFDNDLDDKASYKVSKKGAVVIKFSADVKSKDYTKIVNLLRTNKNIEGVYAEQSGGEVCNSY